MSISIINDHIPIFQILKILSDWQVMHFLFPGKSST